MRSGWKATGFSLVTVGRSRLGRGRARHPVSVPPLQGKALLQDRVVIVSDWRLETQRLYPQHLASQGVRSSASVAIPGTSRPWAS
jgi:hypothetical protein